MPQIVEGSFNIFVHVQLQRGAIAWHEHAELSEQET